MIDAEKMSLVLYKSFPGISFQVRISSPHMLIMNKVDWRQ